MHQEFEISTNAFKKLTLFYVKSEFAPNRKSEIFIRESENGAEIARQIVDSPKGWHTTYSLQPFTDYTIVLHGTSIPYAYLHDSCVSVFESGIDFIDFEHACPGTSLIVNKTNMYKAYDQPFRNQYHFSSIKNWLNDPNGLCCFQGNYHLFFQMNPLHLHWDTMYWGHAVSKDLIHWTHLPIVFFPQETLKDNQNRKGGAYSGCAVTKPDMMEFYFTRCDTPFVRGQGTIELQQEAYSEDGIYAKGEHTIISQRPVGNHDYNFRDPKVVVLDGIPTMMIATTVDGICSVLAYRLNGTKWNYEGIMFEDKTVECRTFECANLIQDPDSDYCAVICSLQDCIDDRGRKRLSKIYVGKRKGIQLSVEKEQILDFGTGSYALQTLETPVSTYAFGWCVDTYDEFLGTGSISNGCMTLPKQCTLQSAILYIRPAKAVSLLDDYVICNAPCKKHNWLSVVDNTYRIEASFSKKTTFRYILAENDEQWVGLQYDGKELQFLYGKKDSLPNVKLGINPKVLKNLEIFVDRSVIEVFVNDGAQFGTKMYFIPNTTHRLSFDFDNPESVIQNKVTMLKNIW